MVEPNLLEFVGVIDLLLDLKQLIDQHLHLDLEAKVEMLGFT
jgi:hypothetical protein